jgi:hypothetical protein
MSIRTRLERAERESVAVVSCPKCGASARTVFTWRETGGPAAIDCEGPSRCGRQWVATTPRDREIALEAIRRAKTRSSEDAP